MTESRRTQIHCHCFVDPTLPNGIVSLPAAACCLMLLMSDIQELKTPAQSGTSAPVTMCKIINRGFKFLVGTIM